MQTSTVYGPGRLPTGDCIVATSLSVSLRLRGHAPLDMGSTLAAASVGGEPQEKGTRFGTAAGVTLLLVPLMAFSHWRLWFPLMVKGRIVLGPSMPKGVYPRQSGRTFGYAFGLGLAGCLLVAVVGRMISG
jgi:hypothetical protein